MKEIEEKLLQKANEIKDILAEEGHDGEYFNLVINRKGVISFYNNYWETDDKINYVDIVELLKGETK